MQTTLQIRGLPRSLETDGWWLNGPRHDPPDTRRGSAGQRDGRDARLLALVVLVGLGDLLFWHLHGAPGGLPFALMAAALLGAAAALAGDRSGLARAGAILGIAALPVLEQVQALSLAFLLAGLAAAITALHRPGKAAGEMAHAAWVFLRRWPVGGLRALAVVARDRATRPRAPVRSHCMRDALRNWALPAGGALVLLGLLAESNPVILRGLDDLLSTGRLLDELPERLCVWAGIALIAWPVLDRADAGPRPPAGAPRALPGVNAGSVLRALWVFNGLLAVQTLTDASILLGGASLPRGMTLAEYTHRGAYPLLVAAVLAGLFALAAQPFLAERRVLRPLMYLWLAQNVLVCLAAGLRLKLYVDSYGLTLLRVHAAIWMALVAAGLVLLAWQVLRQHARGWLVLRGAGLAAAVLYACCFVNVSGLVARYNVTQAAPMGRGLDGDYLCGLGATAAAGLAAGLDARPDVRDALPCRIDGPRTGGWRNLGFRSWRVARYLASAEATE